jgi:hypothetical protein
MTARLEIFGFSSRRKDLESDPVAVKCRPDRKAGFVVVSLQQLGYSDIVQWYGKRAHSFVWEPAGPAMRIIE